MKWIDKILTYVCFEYIILTHIGKYLRNKNQCYRIEKYDQIERMKKIQLSVFNTKQ